MKPLSQITTEDLADMTDAEVEGTGKAAYMEMMRLECSAGCHVSAEGPRAERLRWLHIACLVEMDRRKERSMA